MTSKAKKTAVIDLKNQIKRIRDNNKAQEVFKLNAIILGLHGYYATASMCSGNFAEIDYTVAKSLYNRLKAITLKVKSWKRKGKLKTEPKNSKTYQKLYGQYKGKPKIVAGVRIFPIYGCTFKTPMNFTQDINKYTPQGRQLIHAKLENGNVTFLIRYLLVTKEYDKSVEYNDNRISLMAGQNGKCGVTGNPLTIGDMECHHKKPKELGGNDDYSNLLWLCKDAHKLIHASEAGTILKYLDRLKLDDKAVKKVDSLRKLAENLKIVGSM